MIVRFDIRKEVIVERTAVKSQDIAIVGYESEQSKLEVVFRSGNVYQYEGVPEDIYKSLMEAPSHGLYFREHIKDKFPHTKVRY